MDLSERTKYNPKNISYIKYKGTHNCTSHFNSLKRIQQLNHNQVPISGLYLLGGHCRHFGQSRGTPLLLGTVFSVGKYI